MLLVKIILTILYLSLYSYEYNYVQKQKTRSLMDTLTAAFCVIFFLMLPVVLQIFILFGGVCHDFHLMNKNIVDKPQTWQTIYGIVCIGLFLKYFQYEQLNSYDTTYIIAWCSYNFLSYLILFNLLTHGKLAESFTKLCTREW